MYNLEHFRKGWLSSSVN